ncbi:MAG: glycosyltransferase family 4 protein [Vicinamibacteraceae bacterium]|nr:glycosyltransferase family 4 protein [Vicinamibacteraceae bacterium]
MRLLYLADIRFPLERANGIQTAETCAALAERGHAVTLLVRDDTAVPRRDPWAFYGITPPPTLRVKRLTLVGSPTRRRVGYVSRALARAVVQGAWDAVFTRDLGVAAYLLRLPRAVRPPVVYESHGLADVVSAELGSLLATAPSASTAKQRRLAGREELVWRRADGYVGITARLVADLESRYGVRANCHVVADGVRLDPRREYEYRPPSGNTVVGYAGHLYPWKGVDTLLRAVAMLPNARALIIGGLPSEPDLARLQLLASTLAIADRVTFTGLLPPREVVPALAAAHLVAIPNSRSRMSSDYTSPLKLFEALAAGRPIVASDLPAFREVLADGANALLVEPDAPEAWAAAIDRLAVDPVLADRLARRAFDDAARYTWAARAERLEAVLAEATGRRTSAARYH